VSVYHLFIYFFGTVYVYSCALLSAADETGVSVYHIIIINIIIIIIIITVVVIIIVFLIIVIAFF